MYSIDFTPLVRLFVIFLAIAALSICYFAYTGINNWLNGTIVKTKTKPSISWELKAHKQKVDTIWIYQFK